jgi:hypothetical protein
MNIERVKYGRNNLQPPISIEGWVDYAQIRFVSLSFIISKMMAYASVIPSQGCSKSAEGSATPLQGCRWSAEGSATLLQGCRWLAEGSVTLLQGCRWLTEGSVTFLQGCRWLAEGSAGFSQGCGKKLYQKLSEISYLIHTIK